MWQFKRASSKSSNLSPMRHMENFQDRIFEIYEVIPKDKPSDKRKGLEHTITAWSDDKMLKDEDGNILDIIIWMKGGFEIWEPWLEYLLRKQVFDRGVFSSRFGYIDGKNSHLGPFTETKEFISVPNKIGYTFWIDFI